MKKVLLLTLTLLCLVFALASCGCEHEWEVTSNTATCAEGGTCVSVCKLCGNEKTEELGALGHAIVTIDEREATCAEFGDIGHYYCERCEKNFADSDATTEIAPEDYQVDKLSHKTKSTTAKKATCEAAGNKAYWTCSECNKIFTDRKYENEVTAEEVVLAPLGHRTAPVAEVPATYAEVGTAAHFMCTGCSNLYSDAAGKTLVTAESLVLPVLQCPGHNYGSWAVNEGKLARLCSVCKLFQTVEAEVASVNGEDGNRITVKNISISLTANVGTFTVNAPVAGAYNIMVSGFATDWKRATVVNTTLGEDAALWEGCTKVPAASRNGDGLGYDPFVAFGTYLKKGDNTLKITCDGNETALTAYAALVTAGEEYAAVALADGFTTEKNSAECASKTFADAQSVLATGKNAAYVSETTGSDGKTFGWDNYNGSVTAMIRAYDGGWNVYYANKLVIKESGYYMIGGSCASYCLWKAESIVIEGVNYTLTFYDADGEAAVVMEELNSGAWVTDGIKDGYAGYKCGDIYTACYVELGAVYLEAGEYNLGVKNTSGTGAISYFTAIKMDHTHIVEGGTCVYCGENIAD